ncbi:DUF3572 domain-containing protein [Sphingomonas aerophila]|jgi:2-hydroxychromene-2-carboxylate isomerase|uniref:2-hydroxychromene-2-carboxylate isomerase n=1 Tax=Sphingomonas aerophila TaxID=1344948 RepID=A0A7W9EU76_9SPHN|nr:DUF3572 domain-containing protein [Sphingomonas aerophila]MBB5713362.1 2-hydroxychromene-2-carboxylate isomerase [Sphingomonas aerophila]
MRDTDTIDDPAALALRALVWTLGEPDRASRLLAVTGLDPADLRARAGDPAVLAATLSFLEANEADLVACAEELGVKPPALVAARERLEA